MKGVSQTLWIIVGAIVVLVIGLVVITIFSTGIMNFSSITEATSYCAMQGKVSCDTTNNLPPIWTTANMRIAGQDAQESCSSVLGCSSCTACSTALGW